MRDPKLYVNDILEAMNAIEDFVEDVSFDAFKHDDLVSSVVIQKFEIIGEATKNLPESIKQRYTAIPWREMAGMRDRLIHACFGIKYDLVWNAIKAVFPQIKPLIQKGIDDLE